MDIIYKPCHAHDWCMHRCLDAQSSVFPHTTKSPGTIGIILYRLLLKEVLTVNDYNTVRTQSSHHKSTRSSSIHRHIYVEGKLKESGICIYGNLTI